MVLDSYSFFSEKHKFSSLCARFLGDKLCYSRKQIPKLSLAVNSKIVCLDSDSLGDFINTMFNHKV